MKIMTCALGLSSRALQAGRVRACKIDERMKDYSDYYLTDIKILTLLPLLANGTPSLLALPPSSILSPPNLIHSKSPHKPHHPQQPTGTNTQSRHRRGLRSCSLLLRHLRHRRLSSHTRDSRDTRHRNRLLRHERCSLLLRNSIGSSHCRSR